MGNPTRTKAWGQLQACSLSQADNRIMAGNRQVTAEGLLLSLDLSRWMISDEIRAELMALAEEQQLLYWRDQMFAGQKINTTEDRAVWHVALRSGKNTQVAYELNHMGQFVRQVHASQKFTDIVHIGIGGSDLGPRLVCDGLKHLPRQIKVHFVANVDAADIEETLKPLNPSTTLFVIASKTFTTQETMMNAAYAKRWLGDVPVRDHMIALSSNVAAAKDFGIDENNVFPFWDWVGGRFSVWSSIGMPIALTYGFEVFQQFLNGAKAMDDHFVQAPLSDNMPVLLALYGIWNRNFMDRSAVAVLPYAQNLSLLTNYLQQLDMESNGKSVDRDGQFITDYKTGPVIFGQAGTNGQHAFHQWLHQGTDIVPTEIIKVEHSLYDADHQNILNANAVAQAQAFLQGDDNLSYKHKHYAGGRPSAMILLENLSPASLGQLLALYEHKIFVQGIVWNINSFDQFGVELGKRLAKEMLNST